MSVLDTVPQVVDIASAGTKMICHILISLLCESIKFSARNFQPNGIEYGDEWNANGHTY
jgi:hypothetical protein